MNFFFSSVISFFNNQIKIELEALERLEFFIGEINIVLQNLVLILFKSILFRKFQSIIFCASLINILLKQLRSSSFKAQHAEMRFSDRFSLRI